MSYTEATLTPDTPVIGDDPANSPELTPEPTPEPMPEPTPERRKGSFFAFVGRVVMFLILLRILRLPLSMIGAYLLGSVPFSYLVARAHGVNLREVGSGNIGAGNVWRACGRRAFALAATLDLAKGWLPTFFARRVLGLHPLGVVLVGASAMLGHTYPLFMRFKGGKAVATGGGVLLALSPITLIAGVLAWIGGVAATRITAVGSLAAAAVAALTAAFQMGRGKLHGIYGIFTWLAAAGVVILHRSNIQRLIEGTENRIEEL